MPVLLKWQFCRPRYRWHWGMIVRNLSKPTTQSNRMIGLCCRYNFIHPDYDRHLSLSPDLLVRARSGWYFSDRPFQWQQHFQSDGYVHATTSLQTTCPLHSQSKMDRDAYWQITRIRSSPLFCPLRTRNLLHVLPCWLLPSSSWMITPFRSIILPWLLI